MFYNRMLEFFADCMLNEMAFNKKVMEDKIRALEPQINLHLIKILRYKDDINKQKHINDIMTWLVDIQELNFNKAHRKFSKELYFKLLFTEPVTDEYNIQYIKDKEKGRLKSYSTLPKIRTEQETLYMMCKLHKEIADCLSKNEIFDFETRLEEI
jgi:hypothetical protein